MPKVLDRCVEHLKQEGYSESRAYAICSKKTGWKPAKGGGWKKREGGKWKHHGGGKKDG